MKKRNNSSLLLDSEEIVRVKKFCLDELEEKTEYENLLNNSHVQIIRDEFIFDKLGHAQIVIWYHDAS